MKPLIYNQHKVDQLLIGKLGRFHTLRINVVWLICEGSQELNIDKRLTLFLVQPMSFAHLVVPAGPSVHQCLQRTDLTYFDRIRSPLDKLVKLIARIYATVNCCVDTDSGGANAISAREAVCRYSLRFFVQFCLLASLLTRL